MLIAYEILYCNISNFNSDFDKMEQRENETTVQWLKRLVGQGANEAQLNAVTAILKLENRKFSGVVVN